MSEPILLEIGKRYKFCIKRGYRTTIGVCNGYCNMTAFDKDKSRRVLKRDYEECIYFTGVVSDFDNEIHMIILHNVEYL